MQCTNRSNSSFSLKPPISNGAALAFRAMSNFGTWLRDYRERNGITLKELESRIKEIDEKAGMSHTKLSRIERGKREKIASMHERRLIGKALGLSLEDVENQWRTTKLPDQPVVSTGIPIIGPSSAGPGELTYTDRSSYHPDADRYIDRGDVRDEYAYGIEVDGDSMRPSFEDGDIIIFIPLGIPGRREKLSNGTLVHIWFSEEFGKGENGLFFWHLDDDGHGVTLTKLNPNYPSVRCARDDISRVGVFEEARLRRVPGVEQ